LRDRVATLIVEANDKPIEAVGVTVKDGALEVRGK
jgi:hypothetical protein